MNDYPMISFRCDHKLQYNIIGEAKRQNISVGQLIRQAVTEYLNKPDNNK